MTFSLRLHPKQNKKYKVSDGELGDISSKTYVVVDGPRVLYIFSPFLSEIRSFQCFFRENPTKQGRET